MAGLGVYRQLLANRPLTKLLVGEFISGIGDWLYIVAIFVVIYRESGDSALVGLFGAVRVIPYIVLSVPAGLVADRFERRLVLLVSDIWRGLVMVVLTVLVAANAPVLPITALAILATCGSAFFYPAMGAYMPSLVTDERQLGPANSAWASLQNISFIFGPAIGGVLLAFGGMTLAFILNALTFIVIAVILWTLPREATADVPARVEAPAATSPAQEPSPDVSASAAVAASSDVAPPSRPRVPALPLAGLGIIEITVGFIDTGMQVLTVILAIKVLHAGEAGNGYLNAAIGVGGLIGALGSGVLVLRRNLGVPLVIGAATFGVGLAALGAVPVLLVALVTIAVAYAGNLLLAVVLETIFQRVVPNELRGRWIGVFVTAATLTGAVGALVMPFLVVNVGAAPTLGVSGLAVVISTVAGLALIGKAVTREPSRFEATVAEVAKLPLFSGVASSRLEAVLARVHEAPVTAGQVVVRQGDPADRFYMIESGSFVVTREAAIGATPVVLRQLGANDVFGELGLLRELPRSATVTAESDGVLLELAGKDFLELVGAGGPLRGRLLGLYRGGVSGATN